jgi:cold-inducible RNA-binding protein
MRLYVGNLPFDTTEDDLRELFSNDGEVRDVSLVTDRDTGRSRGFGFVEFANDDDGRKAIDRLNGSDMGGRQLTVNEARPRTQRGGGGGGGGRDRGRY